MSSVSILVTGGSGFLGGALIKHLAKAREYSLTAPVRDLGVTLPPDVRLLPTTDLNEVTDWHLALVNIDIVVHTAARVHVMKETVADPLSVFRAVNVNGTLNLARQAAAAGVKRFVFISSIKVNGEFTRPGEAFTADELPAPIDPYGISKFEAEQGLRELSAATAMDVVIIRPVLVYGPGVKANFLSMMRWLYKGIPLPFGAVQNRRSLISLDNLVDLIVTCLDHPAAANQTFLASDGEDVSTTELLRKLATSLGKSARLLPVPVWLMSGVAAMLGKRALAQRLFGNLQVDLGKNQQLLGWTPPVSLDHGLSLTAQSFLDSRKS
ncbi:SDR family oxidoreductase [Pseudomonas sp. CVAP|uniref:UDP-glucose 4-epimerase family protein n=1 Tax=Pseudomonas sp. CVAP\|nr:SDR family oxidoreductase [Pseudomonas sp. CVAP\